MSKTPFVVANILFGNIKTFFSLFQNLKVSDLLSTQKTLLSRP